MKIAISPCPNDLYLFHAWIAGRVAPPPEVYFADVEELNRLAHTEHTFDLVKISLHNMITLADTYQLLPIGMAVGKGTGPKLIAKEPFSLSELPHKRMAIPGKATTAHALANKFLPSPREKVFCIYHEVVDLVKRGEVECGLLIHETGRTVFHHQLAEIVDLGALWYERYHLPLPLGGIVVRKDSLSKEKLVTTLSASLAYAEAHPEESLPFILEKSQEKSLDIIRAHLYAYVNEETAWISEEGERALERLGGKCLRNSLYLPTQTKQHPSSLEYALSL